MVNGILSRNINWLGGSHSYCFSTILGMIGRDDFLFWDGRKPPNSHVLMAMEASKFKKYGGINNRISWGCNESYYVFNGHNGLKCQF